MNDYFDSGVMLKLYTVEPESAAVQSFVHRRALALPITELHQAECTAALRLKQFRGECSALEATQALHLMENDLRVGVLQLVAVDWDQVWNECRQLLANHSGTTGCRTLDALHVGSALGLDVDRFVTSDRRQSALARLAGLAVIDPTNPGEPG